MKVIRIIARLNVGGPSRHVIWLTKELQDDQFQTTLLAGTVPEGEDDMSYFAAENGVVPIYVKEMSRELSPRDLISVIKIYNRLRAESPDILHTHTAKAGTVGRTAAFFYRWLTWRTLVGKPRKIKTVHTFHGHVFHSYYGKAKTNIFLLIERVLARLATDRIITISPQQLGEINGDFRVGRKEQFRIVPLGIDLSPFDDSEGGRKELRDELAFDDEDIVVGFVGRLTEIKDLTHLLTVAAMYNGLSPKGPRLQFVIVGDGHLRGKLEQEASDLGVGNLVTFLGHRADTARVYAAIDIVALTSLNEGTPLSLIEAMAARRPFISTIVGGVPDLLGPIIDERQVFKVCERGIGIGSTSQEEYLEGLLYLARDNDLRMKLAASGRAFVEANYDKVRLVEDIKELYRGLFAEST